MDRKKGSSKKYLFELEKLLEPQVDVGSLVLLAVLLKTHPGSRAILSKITTILTDKLEVFLTDGDVCAVVAVLVGLHYSAGYKPTSSHLAQVAKLLVSNELKPGGPYRNKHGEITFEDNVVVELFLQNYDVNLSELRLFIEQSMPSPEDDICFSQFTTLYLYGQAFPAKLHKLPEDALGWRKLLIKKSKNYPDKSMVRVFEYIFTLTTNNAASKQRLSDTTSAENKLFKTVYMRAINECNVFTDPLQSQLKSLILKVQQADKNKEIALLAEYFASALVNVDRDTLAQHIENLGVANIFCWCAYTVYDDIIDGDSSGSAIPVANVAMRKSLEWFTNVDQERRSRDYFVETFDRMDQANAWEVDNARLKISADSIVLSEIPNYGDLGVLSDRAAGHGIGVMALANMLRLTNADCSKVQYAFEFYLIARQLNDDLHDWSDDLNQGRCSYVVAQLLGGCSVQPGKYKLSGLQKSLQAYFWDVGFDNVCVEILMYCSKARQNLGGVSTFDQRSTFMNLVGSIEASVRESQHRYNEQRLFLQSYKD